MTETRRPVPIFTTAGDFEAFLIYPFIFNTVGEWIGWVTSDRDVYSVRGHYVGWLSDGPRILRKRSNDFSNPVRKSPAAPPRVRPPGSVPLPPMMPELTYDTIDVLQDEPERLHTLDSGESQEDMD